MRKRRIVTLLALLALVLSLLCGTAFAADETGKISVVAQFKDGTNTTVVPNMTYTLYKVADVDEAQRVTLTQKAAAKAAAKGMDIPEVISSSDAWAKLLNALGEAPVALDKLTDGKTDANGRLSFTGTYPRGIYLVVGETVLTAEGKIYSAGTAWALLPQPTANPRGWSYDVEVMPKLTQQGTDPKTVQVVKVWDNQGREGYLLNEVTVRLMKKDLRVQDAQPVQHETATLTAPNWTKTWTELDGNYVWSVQEVVPAHYKHTITKEVKDDGVQVFTIKNTLDAIFVDPPIRKVVDPVGSPSAPFEFQMKAIRGPVTPIPMPEGSTNGVKTMTITGAGDDEFGEFPLYVEGTYEYEITESGGNAPGYTYDTNKYTLTVEVKRVNGVLTKTEKVKSTKDPTEHVRAETERFVFTNIYTQTSPNVVELSLGVSKVLKGSPKTTADFEFRLVGKDKAPMPSEAKNSQKTVKVHGATKGSFGSISFSKAGTYTYEVSEVDAKLSGYTYDKTVYTVTVKVTEKDGALSVDVSAVDGNKKNVAWDELVFTNTYKDPAPQTGVLWWPVPVLLAAGLLLTFVGVVKRKHEN